MKPILFNTEMVRALLEGRKTVTRRVVKLKYDNTHLEMFTNKYGTRLIEIQNEEPGVTTVKNPDGTTTHRLLAAIEKEPPYRPGDILYVRETWFYETAWEDMAAGKPDTPSGRYQHRYIFKATSPNHPVDQWRPSIHMPKEAARIFLRVTGVRAERLKEMSALRAMDEGVLSWTKFVDLWNSTIKPADLPLYGWEADPWVWVIEFERVTKEEALAAGMRACVIG